VEILEEVGRQVGFPKAIRVDQGTEFVSRDLDLWAYQRGVWKKASSVVQGWGAVHASVVVS
jgi:hypothetical protein